MAVQITMVIYGVNSTWKSNDLTKGFNFKNENELPLK